MQKQRSRPTEAKFRALAEKYDNFFFDCDGVVWEGKNYMQKTFEVLGELKKMGKKIFFVTNTSMQSRQNVYDRLKKNGWDHDIDKIYTASYLAAQYLKLNHPEVDHAYVIGIKGVTDELTIAGIKSSGGELDNNKPMNRDLFDELEVDETIRAVIVGIDWDINYYKLCYASVLIQKGALFIAANADPSSKLGKYNMPVAGTLMRALESAAGKPAFVVGKPNPTVIEVACKTYELEKSRCLMVGDFLQSDILLSMNAGIDSLLCFTGVSTKDQFEEELNKENGIIPTYFSDEVEW